jgi:hypothetical protein
MIDCSNYIPPPLVEGGKGGFVDVIIIKSPFSKGGDILVPELELGNENISGLI